MARPNLYQASAIVVLSAAATTQVAAGFGAVPTTLQNMLMIVTGMLMAIALTLSQLGEPQVESKDSSKKDRNQMAFNIAI